MTDEPMTVTKHGTPVNLSEELLRAGQAAAEVFRGLPAALDRALNATPEQRARWAAEAQRRQDEEQRQRAEERAAVVPVPLTLGALLAKMGWSREYAEHLVQPYCECGDDIDGWSYCRHAEDLGLAP